jgi:hypothetical protein
MLVLRRDGWAIATVTCLVLLVSALLAGAAWAAPDWDGDGSVADDCAPLDPAIHPGAVDLPDVNFEDTNCDGIDGDAANAVFVATSGSNSATGTKGNPLQTINAGIAQAVAQHKSAVYIAGGTYNEVVQLASGVSLYGGYEPLSGARSTVEQTVIQGSPQAVFANGATHVLLQLLTLKGSVGSVAPGASAYGLRAIGHSSVALENDTVSAGPGNAGAGGAAGAVGGTVANGTGGAQSQCGNGPGVGGAGGASALGNGGGAGGGGGPVGFTNGSNGFTGGGGGALPQPGGGGNLGGASAAGQPGFPGNPGSTGASAANAVFSTSLAAPGGWAAAVPADTATAGGLGSGGGGGGGAGGSQYTIIGITVNSGGAGGGGGGAGGLGGAPGPPGGPGGGSFAAYLFDSSLVATGSTLTGGTGGKGGDGGIGGNGGSGGSGGAGGIGSFDTGVFGIIRCSGDGGRGGNGGNGGKGGNGGGAPGGPSGGVFDGGTSTFATRSSTLTGGTAGAGGANGNGAVPNGLSAAALPAGAAASTTSDFDGDHVADASDACPAVSGTGADGCPPRAAKLADSDGDGIPDSADACPATPAGAVDANGDGCPDPVAAPPVTIIQNAAAPPPQHINVTVAFAFGASAKSTRFTKLAITGIPAGAKVTVTCKGSSCPKTHGKKGHAISLTKRNAFDRLKLTPWVKKPLKVGTTLTITVTRVGMVGQRKVLKIRRKAGPKVTVSCLAVGTNKPTSCLT